MTTDATPRFVPGIDLDGDAAVLDRQTGKVYGFVVVPAAEVAATWNAAGGMVNFSGQPTEFDPNPDPYFIADPEEPTDAHD